MTTEPTKPQFTEAQMRAPLTRRDIAGLMQAVAAELKPLIARVAALEQKPSTQYRGIYEPGSIYHKGDFCTHGGSVWFCRSATMSRPGEAPDFWTLAVKRGRDGADARTVKSHRGP